MNGQKKITANDVRVFAKAINNTDIYRLYYRQLSTFCS